MIYGNDPNSKMIALRAELDALAIHEENNVIYRSNKEGIMHACGHDVHIASLLGTAKILSILKNKFRGTVMLIFQSGEEKFPGGAKMMLDDNLLKTRTPDLIIAQHVLPSMESGCVGFKPGIYMASCDEIYLRVKGTGGHAATPHQITDIILIASHIVVALQQIISRNTDAFLPTVLSFGKIIANGSTNVIPNELYIEGTFRTMNEEWRIKAHDKIIKMAQNIAESMGAKCEIDIKRGPPILENDVEITNSAITFAQELLGNNNVLNIALRMTSDDFAYYAQRFPCTYYRLGVRKKSGEDLSLHSSNFDIDEGALATGVSLMTWLSIKFLNSKNMY
jgi:amidohydrolase